MRRAALAACLVAAAIAAACGGGSDDGPSSPSGGGGSASSSSSHNAGRNCQQCHGEFRVAGSVFTASGAPKAGATVRLTTAADGGTTAATLTSDGTGNFFTTQAVSFGGGLYAEVTGSAGRLVKKTPVTTGACNSCHGASAPRLQVD